MPFPQTPLPVIVEIAPGASPTGTVDSWDPLWVDITNDVRVEQRISIEEGIPDEAFQADPGVCSLTLNNGKSKVASTLDTLGCYSPRNPVGPYWGKLARNTPLRVSVRRLRDTFTRVVGSGWGTPDEGGAYTTAGSGGGVASVTGTQGIVTLASAPASATATVAAGYGAWDFNLTGSVSVNAVTTGTGDLVHSVIFRRTDISNKYYAQFDWNLTGQLFVYLRRTLLGSDTILVTAGPLTYSANQVFNFRVKADGSFVGVKLWAASGSEPIPWTASYQETAYNLDNSTLGTGIQFRIDRFAGNTSTTIGTWDDLDLRCVMFVGNAPEWPVRWDKSGNDSTVPFKAAGVLRRLQQGDSPVKSPLYGYLDQFTPTGLWALQDSSGATAAASQTPGAAPAYIFSTTPGGWTGTPLGGTSSQYTVAVDTTISGQLPRSSPTSGWSCLFAFYMPVAPAVDSVICRIRASGTVAQWDIMCSASFGGVVYVIGTDSAGTIIHQQSTPIVFGRWNIAQLEVQQVTTTITGRIVCYDLVAGTGGGATSTATTGTIGAPQNWAIYGGTGFQSAAAGPIVFYPTASPVITAALIAAGRGFANETADARVVRICSERGVRLDLLAGTGSKLGAQASDTLLGTLNEVATTDLGLLTEFHGGLRYRPRPRRYNQNARLALDFTQKHIAEPPEPTDDDQRLINDVTVSRRGGTQAVRSYDPANIAIHGTYDTSLTINPAADTDLPGHSTFRLYLGTWDELRWPRIQLNLAATPAIIDRAMSLEAGALITIANPPSNLPVGTLYLLVEAVKHTLGPYDWDVELVCTPYGPWRILDQLVNATRNRINVVGSTLTTGINASVASISVTNTGTNWSAAAVPFDINLSGEAMTVTSVTGTGTQTLAVTRGVNTTTAKAHTAGEAVNLDAVMYVAL